MILRAKKCVIKYYVITKIWWLGWQWIMSTIIYYLLIIKLRITIVRKCCSLWIKSLKKNPFAKIYYADFVGRSVEFNKNWNLWNLWWFRGHAAPFARCKIYNYFVNSHFLYFWHFLAHFDQIFDLERDNLLFIMLR